MVRWASPRYSSALALSAARLVGGADCAGAYNGAFRVGFDQFGRPIGAVRFAEISDGLSNTFFVGEKHVRLNH